MTSPVLDESVINTLIAELDQETALMILDNFLKECSERLQNYENLLRNKDYETAMREAHSMKSTAASFGAMKMSQLGKEIEAAFKENRPDDAVTKAAQMEEITTETLSALDAWKQSL